MKIRIKNILAKRRKQKGTAVLICAVVLTVCSGTLTGCSSENINKPLPDSKNEMPLKESFKAVLLGDEDFVCAESYKKNKKINLKNFKAVLLDDEDDDESITVSASEFAVLDLDNDGEKEVVLWILVDGGLDYGFEVLRYQDGAVYGYTLGYRELMELKNDGTFIYSGGCADWGIGRLCFSEDEYIIDQLYYVESHYNSDGEFEAQCFTNGKPYSDEEFENDVSRQEEKSGVEWYELTDDNIEKCF